jgi:hypothetical protein
LVDHSVVAVSISSFSPTKAKLPIDTSSKKTKNFVSAQMRNLFISQSERASKERENTHHPDVYKFHVCSPFQPFVCEPS